MKENLLEVINEISKERGFDRDTLIHLVEDAVVIAAKKKLPYESIEGHLNQKTGQIELFQYKTVVEYVEDPHDDISLDDAQAMDENAELGDEIEYAIEEREFNRIAQSARQLIFKRIKEAEREMVYESFKSRKGEILTGIVVRTESNGRIAINFMDKTEAYLFKREQIPGEKFGYGDHIRVYLMDITNDPQKPSQLSISRTHPGLLIKLFEMEVPEIYDGIVKIVNAAREPGKRAKIAVYTTDSEVDPVGACVGMRGSRVQAIVGELQGEKIDIIRWDEETEVYAANALAPSEIQSMEIDEGARGINVWVEPDQLSLAIGRQGQNVRLASKLIGYKINVSAIEEHPGLSIEEKLSLEFEKHEREKEEAEAEANAEENQQQDSIGEDATDSSAEEAKVVEESETEEAKVVEESDAAEENESVEEEAQETSQEESTEAQES